MIVASFMFFLVLFVGIGLAAVKRAKNVVAEARAVRLQLENNECSTNTKTLHRFVDEIQQGLSRINEQIRVTYFA